MNSLTTYWLCRAPGSATEGPFTLGQLKSMYATGAISAQALICEHGGQEWSEARWMLEAEEMPVRAKPVAQSPRQPSFENAMRNRDEVLAKRFSAAVNWMAVLTCLIALVPGLGILGGILAYGLLVTVGTILCVLTIVKGRVGRGIWDLIGIWVLVPLMMVVFQAFGLGAFSAWKERKMAEMPLSAPAEIADPAPAFVEPESNDPFESLALITVKQRARPLSIQRVRSEGDALQKTVWVEFERANGKHIWRMVYKGSDLRSIYSDREGDLAP
jgi:hypothetical protein